jgi:type VI secretion system protein ImpE
MRRSVPAGASLRRLPAVGTPRVGGATMPNAEQLLREGRPDEALAALEQQVRGDPSNGKLRTFLFQLLCVLGRWERALTQLNVAAELDPGQLLTAQILRPALQCEALRAEVFAGRRTPLVFGEPEEWVAWMVRANQLGARGEALQARELRSKALEAAPAVPGTLEADGGRYEFEWLADADPRLGPVLEAVIDGGYFWVPLRHVAEILLEKPGELRDVVWFPASVRWTNGGESACLIPTRYPGSESSPDPGVRLARKTEWMDQGDGVFVGLGQRLFSTDADEFPLLDVRRIAFGFAAASPGGVGSDGAGEGAGPVSPAADRAKK